MAEIIKFPLDKKEGWVWEDDPDLANILINILLEETDYHEIVILALDDDNKVQAFSSETSDRAIELLQAAINGIIVSKYRR